MRVEHEVGGMQCEAFNVRFLIQQQIELLDALDERGLVDQKAQDLLHRLMRHEEEIRILSAPDAG
jgi:redox-regulated HSP33 family molecular chaperone